MNPETLESHGHQEIGTLLVPVVQLRRTAWGHGCQPVQGLCAGAALHQVCERQVRGGAIRAHHHPQGGQLRGHGGPEGQAGHRRPDQQEDHRAPGQGQQAVRLPRFQRRHQARHGQGEGSAPHQPHRHLREQGPRLLEESGRWRRYLGRRLRIPHAALRH